MYLMRKIIWYVSWILSCAAVMAIGIYGYFIVKSLGPAHHIHLKYHAENFLYLAIILVCGLSTIFIYTIIQSRRSMKALQRLSNAVRHGRKHLQIHLKKLGPLGNKIDAIFFELNKLNEVKTLKISTMAGINNFLIDNINMHVLVLDTSGKINNCSKKLLKDFEIDLNSLMDVNIDEFFQGLNLEKLILQLNESHKLAARRGSETKSKRKYSGDLLFYPVFNADNKLSAIICILESEERAAELTKKAEQIGTKETGNSKTFLDRIFKKG